MIYIYRASSLTKQYSENYIKQNENLLESLVISSTETQKSVENVITKIDSYKSKNNILIIVIAGPPFTSEFMKQYNNKPYTESQFKVYILGLSFIDYVDDNSVYIIIIIIK